MARRYNRGAGLIAGVILAVCSIAQSASAASTIYRLNPKTAFQQGCFPPCLCPISEPAAISGTFVLTPQSPTGSFAAYQVSEVNWQFLFAGQQQTVTGSGTFEIGGKPLQQRLELNLSVGGQSAVLFDSGLVAATATFPNIVAAISIHGERCFDKVFTVNASPAPLAAIHPYQLFTGSSFQRGCFPPCVCAPGLKQPLSGVFTLVNLAPNPLFNQFAVVNVNWTAAPPPTLVAVSGYGFYNVGGEFAVEQELSLELSVGGGALAHFDSGLVAAKSIFPLIDATISMHGMKCQDTVMTIVAGPK